MARFGSKLICRFVAVTQIVGVLLTQMLVVVSLPASIAAHAPMPECATAYHCCCCSATARDTHACCCSAGKALADSNPVEALIRSGRCRGPVPDRASSAFQFDWLLTRANDFLPIDGDRAFVTGPPFELPRRPVEPLLPPPKSLAAV